jgi:hypothetical protein
MPSAKKPATSASRARAVSKEPVALKRLNSSLDPAQEALADLRKDTGRDVSQGARDLYKDLRTFISSARRDSSKLGRRSRATSSKRRSDWPAAPLARERRHARRAASRRLKRHPDAAPANQADELAPTARSVQRGDSKPPRIFTGALRYEYRRHSNGETRRVGFRSLGSLGAAGSRAWWRWRTRCRWR